MKKFFYICTNATNDVTASFGEILKSIRLRAITNRNLKESRYFLRGFSLCRQAGFSTELDLFGIYLPKNNSVRFIDSLCEMCLLCPSLTSSDCMVYRTLSTCDRSGKLSNKTSLCFLTKILKNKKQQNPQMQD